MDRADQIPTGNQMPEGARLPKRAWVTPAFEQVALKQALNTNDNGAPPSDGSGDSS